MEEEDSGGNRDGNGLPGPGAKQAAKKQRLSMDLYSVSKTVPRTRSQSPLRKSPPQSSWDLEFAPVLNPPIEHREWLERYADTLPFNPDYDAAKYASTPSGRHANPHLWKTHRGPRPEFPLEGHDPFTPGPFQYTHINYWRHVGNIDEKQRAMVEEGVRAGYLLALVPHGGGRTMNAKAPQLAKAYQEFLASLRFAGYDDEGVTVEVIPPDARHQGGAGMGSLFAQPWSFYVKIKDDPKALL